MRLLTEGFEVIATGADVVANSGMTGAISGSGLSVEAGEASPRRLRVGEGNGVYFDLPAEVTELYARVRFLYSSSLGNHANDGPVNFGKGAVKVIDFRFPATSGGDWRLMVGSSSVDTAAENEITRDAEYLLEFYLKIHATEGQIVVRKDGVTWLSYQGDTTNSQTGVDRVTLACGSASGDNSAAFDDVAVNDTTGGTDASWPGDGVIYALLPNGNGDSSEWTGSDADSVDNYQLVDENGPNDADYVESLDAEVTDLYALETRSINFTTHRVGRVFVQARAKDTAPGVSTKSLQVGIKTGGNEYWDDVGPLSSSFTGYRGEERRLNPDTGQAWTQSDLDGLQAGVQAVGA